MRNKTKRQVYSYVKHYEFKKNRLLKLEQTKGLCEICGAIVSDIHHIDKTVTNHDIENLMALCHSCHMKQHSVGRPQVTFRLNGHKVTVSKLRETSGLAYQTLYKFFNSPERLLVSSYIRILKSLNKIANEGR